MTDVVAALIWNGERFLACQRPAHKSRALLWEFVGGKVEPGESAAEALIRECREELDIAIRVGDVFMEVIHRYPDITVRLILFNAFIIEGVPKLLEHNDIRWITTAEIDSLDFCPADKDILAALRNIDNALQAQLFALRDEKYRAFHSALVPSIDANTIMGVRIPALRHFAKNLSHIHQLGNLPHRYYEENCLHGILINKLSDYTEAVNALNDFLSYVDNWAVCDMLSPKAFKKRPSDLIPQVERWLQSNSTYTVRFAIGVLMKYYLDDGFSSTHLSLVAGINSSEYYVNMMIAWYFATALAKQFDAAVPILQKHCLSRWCHNKTIQKALESHRMTTDQKSYLKSLQY